MATTWQDDVLALSALYLMVERDRKFSLYPTTDDDRNAAYVFKLLDTKGLVTPVGTSWQVTDQGKESLKRAIQAQDVLRQMEVYAQVDVTRGLTPEEASPTDSNQALPSIFDPRFAPNNPAAYDMRLAVINWLAEVVTKKSVVPEMIVFLQKLGSGQFSMTEFWTDIYRVFKEVESIVASAYKWTDMAPEDLELAKSRMQALYTAGQLEIQKREGGQCSGCDLPLSAYDKEAAANGTRLSECPQCHRHLSEPDAPGTPGTFSCPKCGSVIYDGERKCGGCGALIDFSMPAGSSQTDTVVETTTETVWSNDYGYVSYGWFDPWDPFVDAVAFGCLFYDPWYCY
jgi:hypothetical protein